MNSRHYYVNQVRLGTNTYRVMYPAKPIAHGPHCESWSGTEMLVDRAGAVDLAVAWWLAARSPRTLVYLPLRAGRCEVSPDYDERKLDLVLTHHSLGFRPAKWKDVRARLTPNGLQKVTLPLNPFPTFDRQDYLRTRHRECRDDLRYTIAADTLFLTGSRPAYEFQGHEALDLIDVPPAAHTCAEIGIGVWPGNGFQRRSAPAVLHVVRCNDHW
jgi:hypothetical protein